MKFDREGWTKRSSGHGSIDFGHVFPPEVRGVGVHASDEAAVARFGLRAGRDMTAAVRLAWEDRLVLQASGAKPLDPAEHGAVRQKETQVPLAKGRNHLRIMLDNTRGSNHGAWAFAFQVTRPNGRAPLPKAE